MLAQRYPNAFDGIAASAPAINWNSLFMQDIYPSFLMDLIGEYPPSCEVDAITAAAIEACDMDDGVVDGIITNGDFNPMSMVGTIINCTNFGVPRRISPGAATVVQGAWSVAETEQLIHLVWGV
ncbi:Carboxylic ester hydrolase [Tolypocladium paradoxum]|uniref:Carboxylic ester hydrolase n=1 Tax=Tolypocladium paradoxum TaxID=94208 RepID=A0A2S4KXP2_9HYPO|nr:Carboxylic ester hydrolase [Tolypocladium paradoxum]